MNQTVRRCISGVLLINSEVEEAENALGKRREWRWPLYHRPNLIVLKYDSFRVSCAHVLPTPRA